MQRKLILLVYSTALECLINSPCHIIVMVAFWIWDKGGFRATITKIAAVQWPNRIANEQWHKLILFRYSLCALYILFIDIDRVTTDTSSNDQSALLHPRAKPQFSIHHSSWLHCLGHISGISEAIWGNKVNLVGYRKCSVLLVGMRNGCDVLEWMS